MLKDTYIRIRCTSEQKKQIKDAAKLNRTNMSDFIITALRNRIADKERQHERKCENM